MAVIFVLFIIFATLYLLFIKGILWKSILGIFGWIGLYTYLNNATSFGNKTFMTIVEYDISWSIIIPTVLIILAMGTTTIKD